VNRRDGSVHTSIPVSSPCEPRDGMLTELRELGLDVAGTLLVLTLTAIRNSLHTNGRRRVPAVRAALAGMDVGLQPRSTGGTRPDVAQDCADVALWLERRGALRTACGYAEAAAALDPTNANRALLVARVFARAGRMREAVDRGVAAVRLAGRAGDREMRAAAFVALGDITCSAQRYGDAARLFSLARRYARSRASRAREGDGLRGLALVRHAQDRDAESLELMAAALGAYAGHTPSIHRLACTCLRVLVTAGEYQGAVMLGKLLLAVRQPAGGELAVCALLARAAAALGWELNYEAFCLRAILALGAVSLDTSHAEAMIDLARAHGSLAFWPRVLLAADRALADAVDHGAADLAGVARQMLVAAEMEAIPPELQSELFPDAESEEISEGEELSGHEPVAILVEAFRAALAEA